LDFLGIGGKSVSLLAIRIKNVRSHEETKHIIDDVDGKSEDEGINDYKNGGYHPVYVGEILVDRYVIIQKLGWGHFSTVWLSKDFKYNTYVAIKVQKSASHYLEAAYDEVELLQKAAKHSMEKKWLQRLKHHYAHVSNNFS
jgi:serine/threonine-protein kinase SRPK3